MYNTQLKSSYLVVFLFAILTINTSHGKQGSHLHDFSSVQIVTMNQLSETERAALEILVEEIEARATLQLPVTSNWPVSFVPVIVGGTKTDFDNYGPFDQNLLSGPSDHEADGYSVKLITNGRQAPTVFILGNDTRGMLFGVGYFLRKISMYHSLGNTPGRLLVPNDLDIDTYPAVALRGHQLGYRPKVNSYDGFTADMWEQYIRDLIVFGINAIELMPPKTDDADEDPMFPLPQMDRMIEMNNLLVKYGLDTWIWYPLMHGDYSLQEAIDRSLQENESVFSQLTKVDAVFIPGRDPGQIRHNYMQEAYQKVIDCCNRYIVAPGIHLQSIEDVSKWIDKGMRFITFSYDIDLFKNASSEALKTLRKLAKENLLKMNFGGDMSIQRSEFINSSLAFSAGMILPSGIIKSVLTSASYDIVIYGNPSVGIIEVVAAATKIKSKNNEGFIKAFC